MSEYTLNQTDKKRVNKFINDFLKESKIVRTEILKELPFENEMYNLAGRNHSFESIALMSVAENRGINTRNDVLFDSNTILPPCPFCGEEIKIRREKQKNTYFCKTCRKKFSANKDSITSNSNVDAFTYLKVLRMMCSLKTYDEIKEQCSITATTYLRIRAKLIYAMHLQLKELRLYSNIEMDNMYIHASYKGMSLQDPTEEYEEGSLFDDMKSVPRESRKRGGSYSMQDKNQNSCCIFVATDLQHVYAKFIGLGTPTAARLKRKIDTAVFLKAVPDKDPFPFQKKHEKKQKHLSK